jgi:hypothetical protein
VPYAAADKDAVDPRGIGLFSHGASPIWFG